MRVTRGLVGAILLGLTMVVTGTGEATNEGVDATDIGGNGADPGNPLGGPLRTDRTGMGALQRMGQGGPSGERASASSGTELALRSEPMFGPNILATIPAGSPFNVLERQQAWFRIDWQGQQGWAYVTFVEGPDQGFSTVPGATGMVQRIKQAAYNVLNYVPFPYQPATQGGRLGCAQVASTVLKAAGVVADIELGVPAVMDDLKQQGWREVPAPPWRDGDVVCWATYNRSGRGPPQDDTHIGIVVFEGGSAQAINNSSSRRRPEKHDLASYPARVSSVLRMGGM